MKKIIVHLFCFFLSFYTYFYFLDRNNKNNVYSELNLFSKYIINDMYVYNQISIKTKSLMEKNKITIILNDSDFKLQKYCFSYLKNENIVLEKDYLFNIDVVIELT